MGIENVASLIRAAGSVLVIGHQAPDGDSLGSTLGLYHLLLNAGYAVTPACLDKIPQKYHYLPGISNMVLALENLPEVSTVIVLDGDMTRTGLPASYMEERALINIDHHPSNLSVMESVWVDASFAAAGQLIMELANVMGWPVTPDIATCLYTSIATDTGFFRHNNVSPKVFRDAAVLLEQGAAVRSVIENAAVRKSMGELCLIKNALENLSQHHLRQVTIIELPQSVFSACGVGLDEAEGVVEYARGLPDSVVAVLLREVDAHTTRVSLRSIPGVDVSRVAAAFGGGGHKLAAGCTINTPLAEAKAALLEVIRGVLPHE